MPHLLLLLGCGFEETEAIATLDLLRRAQIQVTTVSLTSELAVQGAHHVTMLADTTCDTIQSADYDGIVLPGGMGGVEAIHASQSATEMILDLHQQGKLIAAICAAPACVLAPIGCLANKKATGYPAPTLIEAIPSYLDQPVVCDGKLITAQGPASAIAFALAIIRHLLGDECANSVAQAFLATC